MSEPVARLNAALAGRYRVEHEIGEGGMATVYLAQDLKHQRRVALKVLKPELASAIPAERFLSEIRTTAGLQHPNILPLFDSGEADGVLFYVVPYVEEASLHERIRTEGPLPVDEAVRIACEVAEALDHAHRQGVVHRDIKPGNILLREGRPLVADFGVALILSDSEEERLTGSGVSIGTAGYMSPEQAAGDRAVDPRSDVYSLGCVLYEMLTGEPPFTGPSPRVVLAKQLRTTAPSVRVLRDSVDPALEAVIHRALSTTAADRFGSAGEFAAAIREATDREAAGARRSGPRQRRQRRLTYTLLAVGAAVAVGSWLMSRPPPALSPLDEEKVVVFPLQDDDGGNGPGGDVSVWVHSALAHAAPIRAVDGWARLSPEQRGDIALLTHAEARGIARAERARFYVLGHLDSTSDSIRISLQLYDVRGDSLYTSGNAAGETTELSYIGIAHRAFLDLMPGWLDPGRRSSIDLRPLTERDPAAVALWIAGEREYRQARFASAYDRYANALHTDSLMVVSAVKAALAARWLDRPDSAQRMVAIAAGNSSLLPHRYQGFSAALEHYLAGRGTEASRVLHGVLADYPDWSEAWMALGETHYHLFPEDLVVDSSAAAAFERGTEVDPSYSPPLYHLTEIAARRGDIGRADSLYRRFNAANPDSHRKRVLDLVLACARDGPTSAPWRAAAEEAPRVVLDAAQSLAARGAWPACAELGFRTVYRQAQPEDEWGALVGLTSVLLAQRRYDEVRQLLDEAASGHIGLSARLLHVIGALAGAPMNDRAEELDALARSIFGSTYRGAQAPTLWLLGVWHAAGGRVDRVRTILAALAEVPGDDDMTERYRTALSAHLVSLQGDVASAVESLGRLRPAAPARVLAWGYAEPLPYEQMALARLKASSGDRAGAVRAARLIDHQQPIIYLAFLPASLELRMEAIGDSGDSRWRELRDRLDALLTEHATPTPSTPSR